MAKNPLIRSYPRKVNKPLPNKSAGILDDYAIRKVVATKEGSITRTPTDDIDIANKKYVDDSIGSDHPHQDVKTTASPTFVAIKSDTINVINFQDEVLLSGGEITLDWEFQQLEDDAGTSIKWGDRQLLASGGTDVILDWNTVGTADFKNTNIKS